MIALDVDRYYSALAAEAERLASAVSDADQERPVPTCPDWTVGQLVRHVGRTHRWAAAVVERQATERVDPHTLDDMQLPDGPAQRADWLRAGASRVVDAVRETGPNTELWTWAGTDTAAFWARRMVHETAVHRADAELALGVLFDLDPELAADGVSEWLTLLMSPQLTTRIAERAGGPLLRDGQAVHLHATDDGLGPAGEWTIRGAGSAMSVESGHVKGDVAVRGPAVDLLLVLMRRRPVAGAAVEVLGDAALLDHWLECTAF